ncbi:MAG TPA: 1-deoxy-D-xylulose-5-phosphate synthase [Pirellulales bacterium]|jgi:1-deoxy-D-xylulose-5-phosphate synthase|nr:1-deoxy-D-xylulose-5-phosphate synthase [Pirellulales bacterium]
MEELLPKIRSPHDLQGLSAEQLEQLALEMREALCNLVSNRTAHFASNLGVVELCLALHKTFDFSLDRLIWDTGHQCYPHKMITGRYEQFDTIRTKGGLMGFPNPNESDYDLFMTGHAGCSVSTLLGLRSGDDLMGQNDRHSVAVIGDGALPSGIVFEALNNAGGLKKKLLVILNDNKMSICPRVGGLAEYLDRLRMNTFYTGLKQEVVKALNKVPVLGDPVERLLWQAKESIKAGLHGGMLFEELGFRYMGPIDGHSLPQLCKYLKLIKETDGGPVLLHIVTEKGHGFEPAAADPVFFHTPAPFQRERDAVVVKKSAARAYTNVASEAIHSQLEQNPRVTVMTAAMCQGNNLERVRDAFADRFFDTGICESHAVAFAAGQAKAGLRPIVDIYSTFLQRSYDQIFQEVALQNLPVTFMLDRAGLTGPDGPTHHGMFDLGYMRLFPNMTVMAPGDELDLPAMLDFALNHSGPASLRYPKATAERIERAWAPLELGRSEVIEWGHDGMLVACGTLLANCVKAAAQLRSEGLDVGVINARFIKPLDSETILRAVETCPFVVTVEEGALAGGFGSAVLEAAADAGLPAGNIRRLGVPDRFIEHGERGELLADLGLDVAGILRTCRQLAGRHELTHATSRRGS